MHSHTGIYKDIQFPVIICRLFLCKPCIIMSQVSLIPFCEVHSSLLSAVIIIHKEQKLYNLKNTALEKHHYLCYTFYHITGNEKNFFCSSSAKPQHTNQECCWLLPNMHCFPLVKLKHFDNHNNAKQNVNNYDLESSYFWKVASFMGQMFTDNLILFS